MLDWLILGGGIHGTHLSLLLTREGGCRPDSVRVLDPHPVPLAAWTQRALNVGMRYLRSPGPYHLDTDPMALQYFLPEVPDLRQNAFLEPYRRPSLALFSAHAGRVIEAHGLQGLRLRGTAQGLRIKPGHVEVETRTGVVAARRVVLATGGCEACVWPDWARKLRAAGLPVRHVFEPGFRRENVPAWRQLVVVGGGISAHQLALALARRQPGGVTLVLRHAPRVHLLDSDPGWSTPRLLGPFRKLRDPAVRRAAIREARRPGSVPEEVLAEVEAAEAQGLLRRVTTEIVAASRFGDQAVLQGAQGCTLSADQVILATGFSGRRPGAAWLDEVVAREEWPVAPCGYPLVDAGLRWHPRIYAMGPFAELEIGPIARNIVGAQHAAWRILEAA